MFDDHTNLLVEYLGICGCGMPLEAGEALFAVIEWYTEEYKDRDPIFPLGAWPETAQWVALYYLDSHDLTEHGGNAYGGWLTLKGEAVYCSVIQEYDCWNDPDRDEWMR